MENKQDAFLGTFFPYIQCDCGMTSMVEWI